MERGSSDYRRVTAKAADYAAVVLALLPGLEQRVPGVAPAVERRAPRHARPGGTLSGLPPRRLGGLPGGGWTGRACARARDLSPRLPVVQVPPLPQQVDARHGLEPRVEGQPRGA